MLHQTFNKTLAAIPTMTIPTITTLTRAITILTVALLVGPSMARPTGPRPEPTGASDQTPVKHPNLHIGVLTASPQRRVILHPTNRTPTHEHLGLFSNPGWAHPITEHPQHQALEHPTPLIPPKNAIQPVSTLMPPTVPRSSPDRPHGPPSLSHGDPPVPARTPAQTPTQTTPIPDCVLVFYFAPFHCAPCERVKQRLHRTLLSNLRNKKHRHRVYFSVTTNNSPAQLQEFAFDTAHLLQSEQQTEQKPSANLPSQQFSTRTKRYKYRGPKISPSAYPVVVVYHRSYKNKKIRYTKIKQFTGASQQVFNEMEELLQTLCPEN